jgi:hypothetical protein
VRDVNWVMHYPGYLELNYESMNLNWSFRLIGFFFPKTLREVSSSCAARLTLSRLSVSLVGRRGALVRSESKIQSELKAEFVDVTALAFDGNGSFEEPSDLPLGLEMS